MRRSAPTFAHIANFGVVLGAAGIAALVGSSCSHGGPWLIVLFAALQAEEPSDESCSIFVWLVCVSFVLVFGGTTVKLHRIHKIFHAKKLHNMAMK